MKRGIAKGKLGQFYLVAAIVISVLVIGIISMPNFSISRESTRLQDIGTELNIESEKVFDSAIYNGLDTKQKMGVFVSDYINYINKDESYFIFGDENLINVTGYSDSIKTINVNGDPMSLTGGQISSQEFTISSNSVILTIENKNYEFELRDGKNFYFIIFNDVGGEKHVVTN